MLLKNVEIGSVAMVGDLMSLLKIACTQEQDPGFLIALANGSSKKLN